MPNFTPPTLNFTYWQQHLMEFTTLGYINVLGVGLFWGIICTAIISYIYVKSESAVAAGVAAMILFGGFGLTGIFAQVPYIVLFFQLVVAVAIAGLIVVFITRRRQ